MSLDVITLTDPSSGSTARIVPGFGFNCFELIFAREGHPLPVLWAEPGFETGTKRASASGIPILFPYPGRIRGRTLTWQGQQYPLEGDDHRGNAIHGFVLTRPWRVLEQTATRAVGQFQASRDDPSLRDRWPADFRITVTYELAVDQLRMLCRVENPDQRPLPCGLGLHPYFCVPGEGPAADACRVELPFTKSWELRDMLPTGQLLPIEDPAGYQAGLRLADLQFDDVFTGLRFVDGLCTCRIIDPPSGLRLAVEFDRGYRECVVYNPPHREAVCIEPYSCVPNALELQAAGVDSGLRVLQPGESFTGQMVVRVEG
jgi:aldose 1-epimerase